MSKPYISNFLVIARRFFGRATRSMVVVTARRPTTAVTSVIRSVRTIRRSRILIARRLLGWALLSMVLKTTRRPTLSIARVIRRIRAIRRSRGVAPRLRLGAAARIVEAASRPSIAVARVIRGVGAVGFSGGLVAGRNAACGTRRIWIGVRAARRISAFVAIVVWTPRAIAHFRSVAWRGVFWTSPWVFTASGVSVSVAIIVFVTCAIVWGVVRKRS